LEPGGEGMTLAEKTTEELAEQAKQIRILMEMKKLDHQRILLTLFERGLDPLAIAKLIGVSRPDVEAALVQAQEEEVEQARPGFSGTSPMEVCKRYAIGELTREQVIDELIRWEYVEVPEEEHDYFDDLRFSPPGSFDDVHSARYNKLIDYEIYRAVVRGLSQNSDRTR
ncbi:hypothetical protein ACUIAL_08965, partial [Dermabacteraceae bacterium P13136]